MLPYLLLSLFLSRVLVTAADISPVEDYDVLQYINPLIGSANGGKFEQRNQFHFIPTTNSPQAMCFQAPRCHMAWRKPSLTQIQNPTKEVSHTRAAVSPDSPACTTPARGAILR